MKLSEAHITSTSLSTYLDGEAGPAEERRIAAHLAACDHCRSRLAATRRTVHDLRRLSAGTPPPGLAARVRGLAAAGAGGSAGHRARRLASHVVQSLRAALWWQDLPPLRGSFSTARPLVTAGLALLVAVLLVQNGVGDGPDLMQLIPKLPAGGPEFLVSEGFGDVPTVLPQTTSQVAGRVFVWSDDVWVQRGLDDDPARQARAVAARSPAGRMLLAKFADLGVLLADGSRVVLRDNHETLELSPGS